MIKTVLSHFVFEHDESDEWVTFVHGAGGSSKIWYKQLDFFKERYNVLCVDLRGHGESHDYLIDKEGDYTFDEITIDVIEVLDHLEIEKSHFAGISLGTIIIRNLAKIAPSRVESLIMAGAILKFNYKAKFLIKFGSWFKGILPYMFLYKLFAFIILPYRNHSKSRYIFIREAKKVRQKEFLKWFKLNKEIHSLLRKFRKEDLLTPTLYVMGDQDYLFLKIVKNAVEKRSLSTLDVIKNCGHVVNIEKANIFNTSTLSFLQTLKA